MTECNRKHWLYHKGFDWNVIFEGHKHRLRYDHTALRN